MFKDQPVLADDRVRQRGDAVAAVAAEKLIAWGDSTSGLAAADILVEGTYTTPWIEQACLEPEAALAFLDDDDVLVVHTATQHTFHKRGVIAETMTLPLERVRVIHTVVGGAFGTKTDVSCQAIAALLALKTERPVKIVYSRAESFETTTKRHPFRMRFRTGATKDGMLAALEADLIADTRAYASAGPGLMIRAGLSITGPYHFPSATIHGRVVFTNNPYARAMRGFGAHRVAFGIESQMDLLADRLGIDLLAFRAMNRRQSDPAQATAPDLEQEASYVKTMEAVTPHYQAALETKQDGDEAGHWRRGVGVACMRYGVGASGQSQLPGRTSLELSLSGHITMLTGAVDLGQGLDTALSLIAAEELRQPLPSIALVSGDTTLTPNGGPSTGSR